MMKMYDIGDIKRKMLLTAVTSNLVDTDYIVNIISTDTRKMER